MKLTEPQKQWVNKLKNGETKKASGFLHLSDDSMCCLGVACDMFKDELELTRKTEMGVHRYEPKESFFSGHKVLDKTTYDYLNLNSLNGIFLF